MSDAYNKTWEELAREAQKEREELRAQLGAALNEIEILRSAQQFVDAMFSACCYLDKAIPVQGYQDNAARVRAATDEILRLRTGQGHSA